MTFLVVRYGTAVVLFYIVCRVGGVSWPKDRAGWLHAIISGMFLHGLYLGMVWWAIGQGVPAALSGIIAGLQPLMTGGRRRLSDRRGPQRLSSGLAW